MPGSPSTSDGRAVLRVPRPRCRLVGHLATLAAVSPVCLMNRARLATADATSSGDWNGVLDA
jgi:hypothetical protein